MGEEKDVSAWDKIVRFFGLQQVFMILLRGRPPLCVVTLHFISAWLIASKAEPTLYVTYFIKCVCHEYVIRVGFKSKCVFGAERVVFTNLLFRPNNILLYLIYS